MTNPAIAKNFPALVAMAIARCLLIVTRLTYGFAHLGDTSPLKNGTGTLATVKIFELFCPCPRASPIFQRAASVAGALAIDDLYGTATSFRSRPFLAGGLEIDGFDLAPEGESRVARAVRPWYAAFLQVHAPAGRHAMADPLMSPLRGLRTCARVHQGLAPLATRLGPSGARMQVRYHVWDRQVFDCNWRLTSHALTLRAARASCRRTSRGRCAVF
jgi:hypothetical protein